MSEKNRHIDRLQYDVISTKREYCIVLETAYRKKLSVLCIGRLPYEVVSKLGFEGRIGVVQKNKGKILGRRKELKPGSWSQLKP